MANIKTDKNEVGSELMTTLHTKERGRKKPPSSCLAAVFFDENIAGISAKLAKLTALAAKIARLILVMKASRGS